MLKRDIFNFRQKSNEPVWIERYLWHIKWFFVRLQFMLSHLKIHTMPVFLYPPGRPYCNVLNCISLVIQWCKRHFIKWGVSNQATMIQA